MAISIRARIRNTLIGLAIVLCLLFSGLIFLLVYVIEDQVFVNQLKTEQAAFERVIASGNAVLIEAWQPTHTHMRRIDAVDLRSSALSEDKLRRVLAKPGVHEYFDNAQAMFIAHWVRPDTGVPYYLLYDVRELLAVRGSKTTLFALIAGVTVLIMLLAGLVASRLTKSALAPVSRLTGALQNDDLDGVVIQLANEFSQDEIGVLTQELALALESVRKAAQREYEFNRGVSHELRSPIQVARSAAELLQIHADETAPQIDKAVSRLCRSVDEMNEIAEAFLWLASERIVEQSEMCPASALSATLTTLQATFPDQEIVFEVSTLPTFTYPMPRAVLSLVLRSLVRNAMIHGDQAVIAVEINIQGVLVNNAVKSSTLPNRGFGLGLTIVQRICERFECALNTHQTDDGHYQAAIVFAGNNNHSINDLALAN
ncbi:sensor histidine kinase [Arenicella xantha]|uniref:histidine kinase n=1 Tax=Arenicella xantha TaxID=644221 RepID=A0A395JPC8_9GAMM|nr:HAMP domain-containing sensor histidine kinase [Arenicella xantha]RBP49914.1 signal transduction histidine kinase [Arenicella xantha]